MLPTGSLSRQVFVGSIAVVAFGVSVASLTSAWLSARDVQRRELQSLTQLQSVIRQGRFPWTPAVLSQAAAISGMELVTFDQHHQLLASTLVETSPAHPGDLASTLADVRDNRQQDEQSNPPTKTIVWQGRSFRALSQSLPGRPESDAPSWVVALAPMESDWVVWQRAVFPAALAGGLGGLLAIPFSLSLARRIADPVQGLCDYAAQIARGNPPPAAFPRLPWELRQLKTSLDDLREQLAQTSLQLRRHERLRTLGQIGAGLAHQLRNAATGARLALDLVELPPPRDEPLRMARSQLIGMEQYLQRFLQLGQPISTGNLNCEPANLGDVADHALGLLTLSAQHAGVLLQSERPAETDRESLTLWVDAASLEQALLNILMNAIDAAAALDQPPRTVRLQVFATESAVHWYVSDNGAGVPAQFAQTLWEPFITSKPDGTGLGLTVARDAILGQGGTLDWSREAGWTTFRIALPRTAPTRSMQVTAQAASLGHIEHRCDI